MTTIQAVAEAAGLAEAAASRLRTTVAHAHRAGATVVDLAEAARVARPTIYRWIAMATDEIPAGQSVASCLTQALTLMASLIQDPYQAEQVRQRAQAPIESQLIGMRMAAAWLPMDAYRQMSDEDRMILALASDAESRWIAAHKKG